MRPQDLGPGGIWGSGFGVQDDLGVQDFGVQGAFLGRPPRALSEAGQERERRRRGQELAKLREWRRDEERRRAAEERRRDRAEERAARQRVREKIERDKAERAQRVRLPDGRALTQSFRAREPLAAVRLFVELHRGPGGSGGPG
ncbi:UBX domain-containing protein 1 [Onychostruthus taczanowskii]|uniref:UBX domain-containing protein 1 n=1 Tax=Onychostruthus taczanowskii TaxID=356909 RepID=UPI001B80DC11|nr:UBX domain-containing protein 1 [Onychostruthus taczanowskii]